MFSETQIEELQKLHTAHIANTFLFAGKILDQQRRITDAQTDALHEALVQMAKTNAFDPQQDPTAMVKNAVTTFSSGLSGHNSRVNHLVGSMADAYMSIMNMALEYGNDTFTHFQHLTKTSDAPASDNGVPVESWKSWSDMFSKAVKESSDLFADNMRTLMARSIPVPGSAEKTSDKKSVKTDSDTTSKPASKA